MYYDDKTYSAHLITAKSAELPVMLEMTRAHLRNEELRFDDEYVRGLIWGASDAVEKQYQLALLTQTVVQYHRCFPCGSDTPLLLRIAPLISVTSIGYIDSGGNSQVWDATQYVTGRFNDTSFIVPKIGYSWPTDVAPNYPNAVTVTYQAGFGANASFVPTNIRSALLLMIAKMYEKREDPTAALPQASEHLLRPYDRFSA